MVVSKSRKVEGTKHELVANTKRGGSGDGLCHREVAKRGFYTERPRHLDAVQLSVPPPSEIVAGLGAQPGQAVSA